MDRSPLLRALAATAVAVYVFDQLYMRPAGWREVGGWIDGKAAALRPDAGEVRGVIDAAKAITREASERTQG